MTQGLGEGGEEKGRHRDLQGEARQIRLTFLSLRETVQSGYWQRGEEGFSSSTYTCVN